MRVCRIVISRLFLHTGDLCLEHLREEELQDFAEAIWQFANHPDIAQFFGDSNRYRERAINFQSSLYRIQTVLYHHGTIHQMPSGPPRQYSYPPLCKPRMEAVLERYLMARKLTDRPATVKRVGTAIRQFIGWTQQTYPQIETFSEMTRDHLLTYALILDTVVSLKTQHPLSVASKRVVLNSLAIFFRDIACWGWEDAPLHPLLQGRDLPQRPKSIPKYIPDDELTRLMVIVHALECPYQRAALLIARWSGARRGEIQRLDINCLDQYSDGTYRLRIPAGKTKKERLVPLNEEAALAIHELQKNRQGECSFRDDLTGRMTRYLFVSHGKRLSLSYLFTTSLRNVCKEAGLMTEEGKPLVSAHRFRHTVGTQLAERGAKLHTIMKILGHDSAQMTLVYAQISDQTVLQDYQAVLGSEATIAGPAAESIRAGELTSSELVWIQTNYFKTELELGRCLRLPQEGPCECELYLHCAKFVTTPAYAPRLRRRYRIEQDLVEDALAHGWQREVERHQCTMNHLKQLLIDLGESLDGPEASE